MLLDIKEYMNAVPQKHLKLDVWVSNGISVHKARRCIHEIETSKK